MKFYVDFPVRVDNEGAHGIPKPIVITIPVDNCRDELEAKERVERALARLVNG